MSGAAGSLPLPSRGAALLALPLGFFLLAASWLWPHTVDDTYIYVLYAKNWVEGNGLVFNIGDRVDAMSNFLWVMLMAAGGKVGLPILGWTKALGVLTGAAHLVLAWWMARLAIDLVRPGAVDPAEATRRDALACLVPMLMVVQPGTPYYATAGLGTPLFTLLTVTGVGLHLLDLKRHGAPRSAWCYLPLSIAALTRPEAPLFLVAVAAHRGWLMLGPRAERAWPGGEALPARSTSLRQRLEPELLALAAAVALPVIVWIPRYLYFGDFVNTYYCKPSTFFQNPGAAFTYVGDFAASHGLLTGIVLLAATIPALLSPPARRVAGLLLGIAGLHVAFVFYSGGDWMAQHRFFQPTLALLYATVVCGVALLRGWTGPAAVLVGVLSLASAPHVAEFTRDLEANFKYDHAHRSQRNVEVALWMADNLRPGAGIITDEIGAIGLYSGLVVLDQWGIVDRELAHMFHDTGFNPYNTSPELPLRTESLARIADILVSRNPEYVLLDYVSPPPVGNTYDPRFLNSFTMLELHARMGQGYRYVRAFPIMESGSREYPPKTFLLFERVDL